MTETGENLPEMKNRNENVELLVQKIWIFLVSLKSIGLEKNSRTDPDQDQLEPGPTLIGTKYAFHQIAKNGPSLTPGIKRTVFRLLSVLSWIRPSTVDGLSQKYPWYIRESWTRLRLTKIWECRTNSSISGLWVPEGSLIRVMALRDFLALKK